MTRNKELTGRHILLMLFAFFGVMIVANTAFVVLAVKSFPGESQKKSYVQGLNYNDVLERRARQSALGWQVAIRALNSDNDMTAIDITIRSANEEPLSGLTIDGAIRRSVHDGADQPISFEETGPGGYRAEVTRLDAGIWDLTGTARDIGDGEFDFTARVTVP